MKGTDGMKRMGLLAAALAAGAAGAVTLDSSYVIVKPDAGPSCVDAALGEAAGVLARSLKEGAGLDVKVVKASAFRGGKAIRLGAKAATEAGIDLSAYRHFDNLIAERDGSVYRQRPAGLEAEEGLAELGVLQAPDGEGRHALHGDVHGLPLRDARGDGA